MVTNIKGFDPSLNETGVTTSVNSMQNKPSSPNHQMNWCERTQKNKPQANSTALEMMCLFSGGIMLGNVIFSTRHFYEPWIDRKLGSTTKTYVMFSLSSFLFAAAIAGLSYHYLMKFIPRKLLRQIPSVLFCISAILFIAVPSNGAAVVISRILGGFATAMSLVFFLIKIPEVSANQVRGMNTSIAAYLYTSSGLMLAAVLQEMDFVNSQERNKDSWMNSLRWYGFMILLFIGMGQLISFFLSYESPIYLLQKGDVCAAKIEMCRLRNESNETWEIRKDREELQKLVDEDRNLSANIVKDGNLRALLLVLAVRLAFVFSFNYPLNTWRLIVVGTKFYTFDEKTFTLYTYGGLILGTVRIFALFGIFIFDTLGRKKILLGSSTITVVCGITLASLFSNTLDNLNGTKFTVLVVVAIIYEVTQVLAIAGVADIFTAEAFALPKKASSIGFSIAIEYLLQAILLLSTFQSVHKLRDPRETVNYNDAFITYLILTLALAACTTFVWFKCPETKLMSIRKTRSKFRGTFYEAHVVTSAYA